MFQDCSVQQSCTDGHMSLFHLRGLKHLPQKSNFVPFLEQLHKFHLDLCSSRYSNSPQVSCLGRNPGRGWNPNLEESYLLEYSYCEDETQIQCTSGIYLQLFKFLTLDPSLMSTYSEYTKTISFSILGFFQPGVKLGFDFSRVPPNQKSRPRSINFDFDEEINPMLGSLKNSSSVKIPNFSHQKLKMLRIKFCFDRKMRPSMES